jgi:hypothetical protein
MPGTGKVQGLAWSDSGTLLIALHGPAVSPSLDLTRIDLATGASNTLSVPDAIGPLVVSAEGAPIWLVAPPVGTARLDTITDDTVHELGALPHPRFTRLLWSEAGLGAIEWSGSGLGATPDDALRVVSLVVQARSVLVQQLTSFDSELIDADVARHGRLLALAIGSEASRIDAIEGTETTSHPAGAPIASVIVSPDARQIVYRNDSDGATRTWDLSTGSDTVLLEERVYISALSGAGDLAYSKVTEDGLSLDVCVLLNH